MSKKSSKSSNQNNHPTSRSARVGTPAPAFHTSGSRDAGNQQNTGSSTTKTCFIVCGVLAGLAILALVGYFALAFVLNRINDDNSQSQNTSQTKSGWLDYKNQRFNYTIKYPSNYAKEDSVNGDGATFTLTSPNVEIRSFSVYSSGNTANQYLAGILSVAKSSMPLRQVTEIDSQNQKLGNINGTMKVWKYVTSKSDAEIRIAASNKGNMYNLSLTTDFANYINYLPLIKEMAATFVEN